MRPGNVIGERTYANPVASSRMWLRIFKFKLSEVSGSVSGHLGHMPTLVATTSGKADRVWPSLQGCFEESQE